MVRLLQWLFIGHVHRWKILREARLQQLADEEDGPATGTRFYLQCECCGDVCKRDLI